MVNLDTQLDAAGTKSVGANLHVFKTHGINLATHTRLTIPGFPIDMTTKIIVAQVMTTGARHFFDTFATTIIDVVENEVVINIRRVDSASDPAGTFVVHFLVGG